VVATEENTLGFTYTTFTCLEKFWNRESTRHLS
jgi:hypothetical protein